jgi:hypothetical protein
MSNDSNTVQALHAAKARRSQAAGELAEAEIRAAADAADLEVCRALVVTLETARAAAIVAAKPDAALAADTELLKARITFEIAAARASASTAKHAAAVAELHQAEAAVTQTARRVIDAEMIDLAGTFSATLDAALALGERLRELTLRDEPTAWGSGPTLPAQVAAALERLPRQNPYDVPMSVLRNGEFSHAFARRLSELIDVAAR